MLQTLRNTIASASTLALVLAAAACNQSAPTVDGTAPGAETTLAEQAMTSGTCASGATAKDLQKKVTAAFRYATGASQSPFALYPCAKGASVTCLDELRTAVRNGTCTLGSPSAATVCGLKASQRSFGCSGTAAASFNLISSCGQQLDACWGTGASGFFHSDQTGKVAMMDPEPVVLTSSLSSSTFSTASGYYVNNTSVTATVVTLDTTKTAKSVVQDFGSPCSTTARSAGAEVSTVVSPYPNANYKSCR